VAAQLGFHKVGLFLYPTPNANPEPPRHTGEALLSKMVYDGDFGAWGIFCDYLEEMENCARPLLVNDALSGWQLYQYLWNHRTEHIFWYGANVRKPHVRLILKHLDDDDGKIGWHTMRTGPNKAIPESFCFERSLVVVDTFSKGLDTRTYYWGDFPQYL